LISSYGLYIINSTLCLFVLASKLNHVKKDENFLYSNRKWFVEKKDQNNETEGADHDGFIRLYCIFVRNLKTTKHDS